MFNTKTKNIKNSFLTASSVILLSSSQILSAELSQQNTAFKEYNNIKVTKEIVISLENIKSIIEDNNLTLANERLKVEQSKYLLKSTISEKYPNLNLSSNGLPKYLDGYTFNKPDSSSNTLSQQISTSISAEIRWDIINPKKDAEIKIAKDKFDQAKLNYMITLRDIKLKALKEFYLFQKSIEDLKIANKSVEYSKISLKEAELRLDSGIGTKLEVLEAKTQLSRDSKILSNKISEKKIRQRSFTNILNLPSNALAIIKSKSKVSGIWPNKLDDSVQSSYNYNKNLKRIKYDIAINKGNAKSASASKKPVISIYNTLTSTWNSGQVLVTSPDMNKNSTILNNTVGLSATWNIIDSGKSKYLSKINQLKANQSQNQYEEELLNIRKEVETSFYKLRTSERNILTTKQEVKTAKESLRLTKLKYDAGIATQREIVNQQRDLKDAEVNYIKSITDYEIYLAELQRKTGLNNVIPCKDILQESTIIKNYNEMSQEKKSNQHEICKIKDLK